ncbi:carboxypeptidase-like regulatory domain-containing protein [Belliella sp. DSM 107340]|uniref:Carboxypeptidase-like regulatory domain-containing protein n=1 Tax=Belliella calami TaxID=2923436 RepID=A0ABS9UP01_9BACT|nr:carboxypeptidase-like regulatory domain-containing protein [Belliella calami]MCH7398160.1 carboxypeptidase-like regulatory domain-containing protein [Belliella calami]
MWYSCLCILVVFGFSGKKEVTWKGKVLDGTTGLPIENVHVFYKNDQGITDKEGRFELVLQADEIVTFSHISYELNKVAVSLDALPAIIYLFPKESELDAVEVRPFPTESDFKELILSKPYVPSKLEVNLKKNTSVMKTVYMYIPTEGKGGFSEFMERVIPNGAGGATFFNSGGGGLLQLIKELRQDYELPKPIFQEMDSAKVDKIYQSKYKFLRQN